jgi:tetratricopeptide (TPR) repeat protein
MAAGHTALHGNLGSYHMQISASPEAQKFFDEALALTYGFDHERAIMSYEHAAALDPTCAMCYWGKAYALGPNINLPMSEDSVQPAWEALQKAIELMPRASQREQDYIAALASRYAADPAADRAALNLAYAEGMRKLAQKYPEDLDVKTLLAEALMTLTPWAWYLPDQTPNTYTLEAERLLEGVLAKNPNHPGANHFYIHAVESSKTPERAIPSADRLGRLVPGAGHLVHMPAHTYWRVGNYLKAIEVNQHAVHSDQASIPDLNTITNYRVIYYPHNIHFITHASMMTGQSKLAMEQADKLVAEIATPMQQALPEMEEWYEFPLMVRLRFGMWDEVLAAPEPPADKRFSVAFWHYARGVAFARAGKVDEAQRELDSVAQTVARKEMQEYTLWSLFPASQMLAIGQHTLGGELAAAKGDTHTMTSEFEMAVKLNGELPYTEPPYWYVPPRQHYAAALLRAGLATEAETQFRTDLKELPKNGWSLFGLAEALRVQGKDSAAVEAEYTEAWKQSDVTPKQAFGL